MIKKWFAFVVVTILAGSAWAADDGENGVTPNLDKGTKALEGSGFVNAMSDDLQIQLAYGQFVADGVEVGLLAGLRDNDAYMSTELGVRTEYNFSRDSALIPFLSAGITWVDAEADENNVDTDAALFSVGGGVKYFMSDDVAFAVDGSYLTATDDIFVDSDEGEVEGEELRFLFSLRFYFD